MLTWTSNENSKMKKRAKTKGEKTISLLKRTQSHSENRFRYTNTFSYKVKYQLLQRIKGLKASNFFPQFPPMWLDLFIKDIWRVQHVLKKINGGFQANKSKINWILRVFLWDILIWVFLLQIKFYFFLMNTKIIDTRDLTKWKVICSNKSNFEILIQA